MPKLTIDGIEVEVDAGLTILQACEKVGIEVPRFCYHERLSIAGNCRMCLVDLERSPKPVVACAMPAADGMIVRTTSEKAKKARRGVMEFLLINHPLDCPICDQGGECDLQDQALFYGFDRGRYREARRAVPEKHMGPLIKTYMNRCIHCTRCVRFATEVAGVPEIGAVGRGERMEILTYDNKAFASELSGNVVDLCPVGALTSGPYSYAARPWELEKTESIDVLDALGSNIRVDSRGTEVKRVLPRTCEEINEEWISDKTRFAIDGLKRQRIDRPYVRIDGRLRPATWAEAFTAIGRALDGVPGSQIAAIAGDLADCESMLALKDLMAALGSPNLDCRQDGAKLDPSCRAGYLFNSTIAGVLSADACLLIGTNPRVEAPVLNARIRKRWIRTGLPVVSVGPKAELTYPFRHLANKPGLLKEIAAGTHEVSGLLKGVERPMLILGQAALRRRDGAAVLALAREIAESHGMIKPAIGWNGFNVLHTAAARAGGLDVGFVPGPGGLDIGGILAATGRGEVRVVYLLGADEIDTSRLGSTFVIYQGHHGDAGANRADVVLPGAAYTEKAATWVNTEGRPQRSNVAVLPPGEAREDWKIIRALSEVLGRRLPYDSLRQIAARLRDVNPIFSDTGAVTPAAWGSFGVPGDIDPAPFLPAIANFYMTDPISRASITMAKCTEVFVEHRGEERTGTHA
jgi:NADH-quinone oxidoreductase subunit G